MLATVPIPGRSAAGRRYGLGLEWTPLSCGGGYWGHHGDILGYHFRGGIMPRARRAVTAACTGDATRRGAMAGNALIDHQLCGEK